uniref:Putative endo-1,4-beta-xylanase B n=1 Tax=Solibacter usitatus (strain Ellin6076) TaxID=234267 RepID=Q01Z09_SOLUE
MLLRLACASLVVACAMSGAERGEEIRLWPNGAPGSVKETAPEVFAASDNPKLPKQFTVVHYPSVYAFLPPKEKANGMAVVIAPGGGHSQLVIAKEGWDIAEWMNNQGIAAFVLKYRLAKAKDSHYTVERDALADTTRAMRLVRSRAKEFGVDPARIGFIGFSAGGYLAALIETRFDAGNDSSPDPIERAGSRPDFDIIVYPGYAAGSITVPKNAPPAFLACADNDPSHVVTTVNLYLDLQKQGISSEMHIYASGGHGFGIKPSALPVSSWPDRLKEWMVERKFLKQ